MRGWRYFDCDECGTHWREPSADYQNRQASNCPLEDCKSFVHGGVTPYSCEPDLNVYVSYYNGYICGGVEVHILPPRRQW